MKRIPLLLLGLALTSQMAMAQLSSTASYIQRQKSRKELGKIVTAYTDSLTHIVDKYATESYDENTAVNPYCYRLFAPVTLYKSVVSDAMSIDQNVEAEAENSLLAFNENEQAIRSDEEVNVAINNALMNVYLNDPQIVRYTENQVMKGETFNENVANNLPRDEKVTDLLNDDIKDPSVNSELLIKKPNFWKKTGKAYLQFTQNYISSNWYKGGESNNTMLSGLILTANYNDEQKVQWDNTMEWKLGFLSSRSDTLHKYKTNTDLIRLTSKLGLRAVKHWYYTVQAEFYTQFFATYKSNNPDIISNFLSPGYLKVDLGMDYKRSTKTFEVSAVIAPLSYKMTYVRDRDVDETKFSIDEGKRLKNDLGSNIQITSAWKIIPQVVWNSRISYFTTYKKSQSEWENTFDFNLNKYLSTKLFVHARFDDGVKKRDDSNYFQLMELLSFGLSYNW